MANAQMDQIRQLLHAQLADADLSLAGIRAAFDNTGQAAPLPEGVSHEGVDAGGIEAEWNRPDQVEAGRTLLYFHGGGYMGGSILSSRSLISRIAIAARAPALSVAYRRAPEDPFPAAVDDAVAAYRWLLGTGVEASECVVTGTSAGAGLALAMALRVRDQEPDLELPAGLALMSAWVDLRCDWASLTEAGDPFINAEIVRNMAAAYLAGRDPSEPLASPLLAELAGLPPMILQVGGAEGLHDENLAFASAARAAGVDLTLEVWDDMIHSWQVFAPMLDDAQRAIDRIGEWIDELQAKPKRDR